jgi:hypothetical protein
MYHNAINNGALILISQNSSVSIATRLWTEGPRNCGLIPSKGKEISLFYTVPRLTLGPTQHHIPWVVGAVSQRFSDRGMKLEADHSLPSTAEVKNGAAIFHSHKHLRSVVLN